MLLVGCDEGCVEPTDTASTAVALQWNTHTYIKDKTTMPMTGIETHTGAALDGGWGTICDF